MLDRQLVAQALEGDSAAFGRLVTKHYAVVRGLAIRYLRDTGLADDIAQEVFVRAYSDLDTLRDQDRFGHWVCRIASNLCRMALRRKRMVSVVDPDDLAVEDRGPDSVYEGDRIREQLWDVVGELPHGEREALVLYYLLEEKLSAVSKTLGISKNAAAVRLHRGRQRLKEVLTEMGRQKLESVRIDQFVDWTKLTDSEIQATLKDTLTRDLATALVSDDAAAKQVEERVFPNISEMVQGMVRQFIDENSPSDDEIGAARKKIVETIKALQEGGAIRPAPAT